MRQNRSFTQRQKHAIQPCRLSLGGPLFGPIPLAAPDPKRTPTFVMPDVRYARSGSAIGLVPDKIIILSLRPMTAVTVP